MKRHLVLILFTACATTSEPVDSADDAFLSGGKSDSGISEGSPDALGVLRVANELSRTQLDVDVGLTSTAAKAIDAYRLGTDATANTADDRAFHTLAELDAVKYVGAVAFTHLLAYAREHGYVAEGGAWPADPWVIDKTCEPMTFTDAVQHFQPGETVAYLSSFTLRGRTRRACDQITGCSPWFDPLTIDLAQLFDRGDEAAGTLHELASSGNVSSHLEYWSYGPSLTLEFEALEPSANNLIRLRWGNWLTETGGDPSGAFEIEFLDHPLPGDSTKFEGSTLYFADSGTASDTVWDSAICADGRFHLVSRLGPEFGAKVGGANDLNQIAIYGKFN